MDVGDEISLFMGHRESILLFFFKHKIMALQMCDGASIPMKYKP